MDIEKALYQATLAYPYYARAFAAMTPVRQLITIGGHPTIGVDKYWRIYWSPEALEAFQYNLAAVICHEVEHLLREHSDRLAGRETFKWNVACDCEINDDIEDLPSCAVSPSSYGLKDGLTAEQYYSQIPDQPNPNGQGQGTEGSGVTGVAEGWELGSPGETGTAGIQDEIDAEILRDAIASDIVTHNNTNPGSISSHLLLWAEARAVGKLPRISWKKQLSRRLQKITKGRQDYSYAKTSRRQNRDDKCLLPGMVAYSPSLYIVIDTSGSMSDQADWIAGILRDVNRSYSHTHLVDCDCEVQGQRPLRHWKDILKAKGGGGTDMRIGIAYAQKQKADLILILSDGYTPWPDVWPPNVVALLHENDKTIIKRM